MLFHQTLSRVQCRAVVDWLKQKGRAFYLECNSGLYASPDFKEKGDPAIRLYQQRKGLAESQSVEEAVPGMIWGADLYRDDVSKISFILEGQMMPGRPHRRSRRFRPAPGAEKESWPCLAIWACPAWTKEKRSSGC